VLRLALSPRWFVWHLLTLGAMVTCGFMAAWQWGKAGTAMGSALNVGYGLQWPVFAVFFGYMWWRFLRLEARRLVAADAEESAPEPAGPAPLDRPAAAPEPAEPSPFGVRRGPVRPVTEDEDPQLAAYNRMLAELAAHDEDPDRR
jgi:hypothetical protein